jgi:DNA polymerase-3 subunit gamma/tau
VSEPEKVPVTANLSLNQTNWTQTIASVKLAAIARQLADNCSFLKLEGTKVYLSVSPELAHLATPKSQERIETALSNYLDQSISIVFDSDNTSTAKPTLAAERAEAASVKLQQAKESIHNDPAVEAMKNTFDARIIESTIKPID